MDLLPQVSSEFSFASYWEKFFSKRKNSFEWYGNYFELCGILHRYMKVKDDVLVAGCGNSKLSEQLYDAGFHKITNIDINKSVLDQMQRKNEERIGMTWLEMDVFDMKFLDNSYSVVIDKGTLDALMSDSTDEASKKIEKIFTEISRVLRFGGRYICVTLAQDHILNALLTFFPSKDWIVRMHKVWTMEELSDETIEMPVFALIFTKFTSLPEKIFEICLEDGIKPIRLNSSNEAFDFIKTQQYYAMLRRRLALDGGTEQPVTVSLFSPGNITVPRYCIHIVESSNYKRNNKFGVFIIPRGREYEWLFNSDEGRRQVAHSAQFKRLAFVALSRDHEYTGMKQVQDELSSKVMELAPAHLPRSHKVPFLSVGADDIGELHVRYKGQSSFTGEFVVEDFRGEGGNWFRQIHFSSNCIQTAVKLKEKQPRRSRKSKKKDTKEDLHLEVDPTYIASEYLNFMIAGLVSVVKSPDSEFRVLILGLGGGSLVLHLLHYFPRCHVEAVDIDPAMVQVCRDWFGLSVELCKERVHLHVCDAIDFVTEHDADSIDHIPLTVADKKYDVVVLDIDSKDESLSLRCPPPLFLSQSYLEKVKELITDSGAFMMNLLTRDKSCREEVLGKITSIFSHAFTHKCSTDVNEVVYCYKADNCQITDKDVVSEWKRKGRLWESEFTSDSKQLEISQYFDDVVRIS